MSERKRQKTTNSNERTTITIFEHLPNELILLCFDYFDFHWLYEIFFGLNQRFHELISHQARILINLSSIPQGQFLTFSVKLNELTTISHNYPLSLTTDDERKLSFIFEDDLFKDQFSKLKSLTLSNIKVDTLYDIIFGQNTNLCKTLQRLSLLNDIIGEKQDVDLLCCNLISSKMKSLKYLNINFEPYSCGCETGLGLREDHVDLKFEELSGREKSFSHLETLVIGYIPDDEYEESSTTTKLGFNTLTQNLLPCLPKLKNLIINAVYYDQDNHQLQFGIPTVTRTNFVIPLNLKLIKIWTHVNKYNQNEKKIINNLLRNFFMNKKLSETSKIKIFKINNKSVLE